MVYKDARAKLDTDHNPAFRPGEVCFQCLHNWSAHVGWACPGTPYHGVQSRFCQVPPGYRYLTVSMRDSLNKADATPTLRQFKAAAPIESVPTSPAANVNNWRAWSHNVPGECACGIQRSTCTYHRE